MVRQCKLCCTLIIDNIYLSIWSNILSIQKCFPWQVLYKNKLLFYLLVILNQISGISSYHVAFSFMFKFSFKIPFTLFLQKLLHLHISNLIKNNFQFVSYKKQSINSHCNWLSLSQWTLWYCNDVGVTSPSISPMALLIL